MTMTTLARHLADAAERWLAGANYDGPEPTPQAAAAQRTADALSLEIRETTARTPVEHRLQSLAAEWLSEVAGKDEAAIVASLRNIAMA